MFALSHVSTVAYALVVVGDVAMAVAFTANALCCFAVVGMTAYKRGWVTLAPSAVTPVGRMEGSAYLPEAAGLAAGIAPPDTCLGEEMTPVHDSKFAIY